MSLGPGGITYTINCLIICGFPGIGKTTTFNEIKMNMVTARAVDMDVKDYGTTNGINVADPAAYVREIEAKSKDNALIMCTCDPEVRAKLREAHLFYAVVAPEFPPNIAQGLPPQLRPDPLQRAMYMKRFDPTVIGTNTKAGQTLAGEGYTQAIIELFNDPMPHIVAPFINKQVINQVWSMVEQTCRQYINPDQLMGMGIQQSTPQMLEKIKDAMGGKLPPNLMMPDGTNANPVGPNAPGVVK